MSIRTGTLTPYVRNAMLHQLLGHNSAYVVPDQWWFALLMTEPVASDYTLSRKEPSATVKDEEGNDVPTGYRRVSISTGPDSTAWVPSGVAGATNVVAIEFPQAQADWGYLRFWAALSAEYGGSILAYGMLQPGVFVPSGTTPVIPPNGVSVGLDAYDKGW